MKETEEGELLSVDDLACILSYSTNIDKSEWEKLIERHSSISKSLHTGIGISEEYDKMVTANKEYLRVIPFHDDNPTEKFIRTKLEESIQPHIGKVKALQICILGYDRIIELVKD